MWLLLFLWVITFCQLWVLSVGGGEKGITERYLNIDAEEQASKTSWREMVSRVRGGHASFVYHVFPQPGEKHCTVLGHADKPGRTRGARVERGLFKNPSTEQKNSGNIGGQRLSNSLPQPERQEASDLSKVLSPAQAPTGFSQPPSSSPSLQAPLQDPPPEVVPFRP